MSVHDEDETAVRASDPPSAPRSSRFQPGDVLAGRYRMVGVIGKGGMGEVYRVQDLTLEQEVALKFLPEDLASDPHRLALFHNELRIARRVTHPNVVRLHDIGEVGGRPFLSMEYVQGEDLASLLRRVGRLPEERGLELARQLCAGLAAAHEEGILHRDLKPANVLIDENGRVRITDFGLASLADDAEDAGSGTPAYMAPEQLSKHEVSVQSELFSLGLILYEIFTGRKAFEAQTLRDIVRAHENWSVPTPSSSVRELSAPTEVAILQCLSASPEERPKSALALSAMLPGGDALAEALAAGRTPSPDLVAAAGEKSALEARHAAIALVVALIGSLAAYSLRTPAVLINQVPFDRPPEVLIDRAKTTLAELGFELQPHSVYGFYADQDYLAAVRRGEIDESEDASPIRFWYRESREPLVPIDQTRARPSRTDPPYETPGMVQLELDWRGRLLHLRATPSEETTASASVNADWRGLLDLAEMPLRDLREIEPEITPPLYADERRAWERRGTRIEAAALAGQPVWFQTFRPWTGRGDPRTGGESELRTAAAFAAAVVLFLVLLAAVLIARRNLRLGRGDKTRALGLAAVSFSLNLAIWSLLSELYPDPGILLNHLLRGCAVSLFPAGLAWLIYMALEPYVRRLWPQGLIGWTRLFSGRYRDPRVGRDILIGGASGALMALGGAIQIVATSPVTDTPALMGTAGFRYSLMLVAAHLNTAINNTLLLVLIFVLLWMVVRRSWLALGLLSVLLALLIGVQVDEANVSALVLLIFIVAIGASLLWRFGVLALVTALFFEMALRLTPFTTALTAWYATPTLVALAALVGTTLFAFVSSRAGEPLFGRPILPD